MRKLGAWLIKSGNKISEFFEYLKYKWNKFLLIISFKTKRGAGFPTPQVVGLIT